MFKAQLPCLHHSIPSSCCNLRGCNGILSGVSVNSAELLWLCCSLLCSCCGLCGCACVLSKVFHVTATAFQNAPYTTQLVLYFAGLCVCIASRVCYVIATAFQSAMHISRYLCSILRTHSDTHSVPANCCHFLELPCRFWCVIAHTVHSSF